MIYLGFPLDLTTNLLFVLKANLTALYVLSRSRYEAERQRQWFETASPGDQYRFHVKNGGYRP